jgi:hypothetical protein
VSIAASAQRPHIDTTTISLRFAPLLATRYPPIRKRESHALLDEFTHILEGEPTSGEEEREKSRN